MARSIIRSALQPAADRTTLVLLAKLSALVAQRADSDAGAEVQLAAYAERLREYPADIVAEVLRDWPNRSQWWPTWFELRERLEPKLQRRLAMLEDIEAIERKLNTPQIAPDPEAEARFTAEQERERAEVGEKLRGLVVRLSDARKAAPRPQSALSRRFNGDAA